MTLLDGFYGVVEAHTKATELGVRLIVGAEVTVTEGPHATSRIVLLAQTRVGYANLCQLTTGRLRAPQLRASGLPLVACPEILYHSKRDARCRTCSRASATA